MPHIGDFWSRFPDISININPSVALVNLAKDNYDMAIRYGSGTWSGLNSERLLGGDFCVVARPDVLAGRTTTCLEDVADIPWLMDNHMMERRALLEVEGVDFETANVKMFMTNTLAMAAVEAGLGMSIQTQALVQSQLDAGTLINVCALDQKELSYHIVTRKDRQHKDMRVFIKWLHEMAKTQLG